MGKYHLMRPIGILIVVGIVVLCCSCATKTRIEYRDRIVDHYNTVVVHDTLREHTSDSIFEKIYVKGDTVFNTKYVEKTRWKDKIVEKHDTCWRDSIATEYKEKEVEVKYTPKIYVYSLVFSILVIIFALLKITKKVWLRTKI